jgi:hypothetical protein
MKPLFSLFLGICICGHACGLDPVVQPDEWEAYKKRILQDRAHEKPIWERPKPGLSPVVAIQTLILHDFSIENGLVEFAFGAWQDACRKSGVSVQVFLDPAALMGRPVITHTTKSQTAAEVLSYLENLSLVRVRLMNDIFLAGIHADLDPHSLHFRVWLLSDPVAELLGMNQAKRTVEGKWIAAEICLKAQGAAFPLGTYADYHPELRSLVVINNKVSLDAISELIIETQGKAIIREFKDRGLVEMDSYGLDVRRLPLEKENAKRIGARLIDGEGKLVPFAASTKSWAKSRGMVFPEGGSAWLDRNSSILWLRSRPDALDEFSRKLEEAQKAKREP